MIRFTARWLIFLGAFLGAGCGVLLLAVFTLLYMGKQVPLQQVTPIATRLLAATHTEMADAHLTWQNGRPYVQFDDLSFRHANGATGQIDQLEMGLKIRRLLQGKMQPKYLHIDGLQFTWQKPANTSGEKQNPKNYPKPFLENIQSNEMLQTLERATLTGADIQTPYGSFMGEVSLVREEAQSWQVKISGDAQLDVSQSHTAPLSFHQLVLNGALKADAHDNPLLYLSDFSWRDGNDVGVQLSGDVALVPPFSVKLSGQTTDTLQKNIVAYLPDVRLPGLTHFLTARMPGAMLSNVRFAYDGNLADMPTCDKNCGLNVSFDAAVPELIFHRNASPVSAEKSRFVLEEDTITITSSSGVWAGQQAEETTVTIAPLFMGKAQRPRLMVSVANTQGDMADLIGGLGQLVPGLPDYFNTLAGPHAGNLTLTKQFGTKENPTPVRLQLSGVLPSAVVHSALPEQVSATLQGQAPWQADMTLFPNRTSTLSATADATFLAALWPSANLTKAAGEALTVRIDMQTAPGEGQLDSRISGVWQGASALHWQGGGPTWQLTEPVRAGGHAVAHALWHVAENEWLLQAEQLDLSGLEPKAFRLPRPSSWPHISAEVGTLLLPQKHELRNLDAAWQPDQQTGFLSAFADGAPLLLSHQPRAFGQEKTRVNLDNIQPWAKLANADNKLRRGVVWGNALWPNNTETPTATGTLYGHNLHVRDFPVLVEVLNLLNLETLLQGNSNVVFDDAIVPLALRGELLRVNEAMLTGKGLSVGLDSTVDFATNTLNLDGQLTPSVGGNRFLRRIPLVHLIIGKQQGLFTADFKVKGPLAAPRTTVKPLSLVMPGVVKDIYDNFKGHTTDIQTPPLPEQTSGFVENF